MIDPDEEVATAVADVFTTFTQAGSAYGVVAAFTGRRFPRRAYGGVWAGQVRFDRLTHSRVCGVLANPVYAGAYVFGRYRSRRTVAPDGSVRTSIVELPREQWTVCIRDHHPGYIDWTAFEANAAQLTANRTNAGARPPREGTALCQGIIFCGSCGRAMSTRYADAHPYYECAHSRADHVATPTCRSVRAATVDAAVTDALLAALAPDQLALALAAAGEVTARRARTIRAAELAVERARYAADRAERTFLACEPENRLVARSLESRWEARLVDLTGAETTLTGQAQAQTPLPPPEQLAAAVADMHTLWAATSTSDKDRKRLLRTLLGDVTLRPGDTPRQLRVGLRWKSGAATETTVHRMSAVTQWRRASPETIELARELGPKMTNTELADALNAAGQRTGAGHPFDAKAACNLRHAHRIASPATLTDGELTPRVVANRLKISTSTVHDWLTSGFLVARHARGGHWAITFTPDVEAACQARLAASGHIHRDADDHDRQPGELSIAETATGLGVKADVVYYWAHRGYLPTRRGKSGRRWVSLTPDLEECCRRRILDSYKLPDQVKTQTTSRTAQSAERTAV